MFTDVTKLRLKVLDYVGTTGQASIQVAEEHCLADLMKQQNGACDNVQV